MKNLAITIVILWSLSSCEGFLEEKPLKSILVPQTLGDVRALLDNYTTLNDNALVDFILADDWTTPDANWTRLNPWEQNAYLWMETIYDPTERSVDYSKFHRKIFTANVALDVLEKMPESQESNMLKGEAYFVRAMAMFQLAQLFLPTPNTSGASEIKIPFKLSPDVNTISNWWTVTEVLNQVEADLKLSFELLPPGSLYKTRPNRITVKALLSRLYLYLEEWEEAYLATSYVLDQNSNDLMDYRDLDSSRAYPFSLFNSEVLYYGVTSSFSVTASSATFVNPDLIEKYAEEDLRKNLFFSPGSQGYYLFRGSYNGDYNLFTGISLPEIYLTASESLIRLGREDEGLSILSSLLVKRYDVPQNWEEAIDPLALVLDERQKELVFRGTRWMDLKRLKARAELSGNPVRVIGEQSYRLELEKQFTLELPLLEQELEVKKYPGN